MLIMLWRVVVDRFQFHTRPTISYLSGSWRRPWLLTTELNCLNWTWSIPSLETARKSIPLVNRSFLVLGPLSCLVILFPVCWEKGDLKRNVCIDNSRFILNANGTPTQGTSLVWKWSCLSAADWATISSTPIYQRVWLLSCHGSLSGSGRKLCRLESRWVWLLCWHYILSMPTLRNLSHLSPISR